MSFDNLGVMEIVIVCVLALAVVGFIKGLIRTLSALVCLAVAGYAAFWGNENAFDFTTSFFSVPHIWIPKIVALACGLVVFFICRYLLKFIADPFDQSKAGGRIGFGLPAAALSLCAGLALLWLAFTGVRYAASLSELRDTQYRINFQGSDQFKHTSTVLLKARDYIDSHEIGQWQRNTDPFYKAKKLALSQFLVMYYDKDTRKKLLQTPKVRDFLNEPDFVKLAYSDELKSYDENSSPRQIFNSSAVKEALLKKDFMMTFSKLELDALLKNRK